MSNPLPREWTFYVADMIRFAEKVSLYTRGMDRNDFVDNGIVYDATLRNLELIGEAATKIPDAVRAANPMVPWRRSVATRNRLIHGYLGIDDDTIWSIVRVDVPELLPPVDNDAGRGGVTR